MKSIPQTTFEEAREKGIKHKKLDDAEQIEWGEPHPYTGKRQTRPKSVGQVYDIPPADGTYCENKVDHTGAVDVNELMKKWDPSGQQFNRAISQGMVTPTGMHYDDFTDGKTLQEALDIANHAKEQFAMLPANLRNRFENNPINFLNYVNDPNTLEEQYSLGIRVKKVEAPKDATIQDVVNAVKETARPKKTAPKGGEGDE